MTISLIGLTGMVGGNGWEATMTLRNMGKVLSSKARVEEVDRGLTVLPGNGSLVRNRFSAAAFKALSSLLQSLCFR